MTVATNQIQQELHQTQHALSQRHEYTQSMERELYERRQLQSAHHQGLAAPPTGRQIPAPPMLFTPGYRR